MSPTSELEPIMKVEVATPEAYIAAVLSDLRSRRGDVRRTEQRDNAQVIHALVPLAKMSGYVSILRSMTQGRATFTMQYDH
jgi:elongation factor G